MFRFEVAALLLLISASPGALAAQEGHADCKRSASRVAVQLLAGTVGAWVGGMGAWAVFDDPEGSDRRVEGDAGYTPNANTAYALGSWVGATAGVYLTGSRRGECGSLLGTALGTGVVTLPLFLGRHNPYLPVIGVVVAAPLQGLMGTVGFSARW